MRYMIIILSVFLTVNFFGADTRTRATADARTGASVRKNPNLNKPIKRVPIKNSSLFSGKYQHKKAYVKATLIIKRNLHFYYVINLSYTNRMKKIVKKGKWMLISRGNQKFIRLYAWKYKQDFRIIKQGGYISLENMYHKKSVYYPVR